VQQRRRARARPELTWDGLPVAADEPHGAAIVVRRPDGQGGREYLLLHRAHRGPDYDGDWAWTPPSGARLPGEPVLAGALRELAEEAGIAAAEPVPVDLSGPWAVLLAEVPARTRVRLDAEHDQFRWVSAAEALSRCRPASATAGLAAADAVPRHDVAFRPLTRADLPDLIGWQSAPHAARWFPENLDLAAAERKYGPRIDGRTAVRVHVVLADGQPCGFIQHYPLGDQPGDPPTSAGLDFAIGLGRLTGVGLGPQLIWAYLLKEMLPAWPQLERVVASPEAANARSVRVLAKAGFRPADQAVPGDRPGQPELPCVLDRHHMLGR
jgi:8-oxo-dGTP pyrophosphatase MutT (NUDIX family)